MRQGAHVADSLCAACGLADASSTHWRVRLFQTAAASSARPLASFCSCDRLATTLLDARSSLAVPVRPLPAGPQRRTLLAASAGVAVLLGSCPPYAPSHQLMAVHEVGISTLWATTSSGATRQKPGCKRG